MTRDECQQNTGHSQKSLHLRNTRSIWDHETKAYETETSTSWDRSQDQDQLLWDRDRRPHILLLSFLTFPPRYNNAGGILFSGCACVRPWSYAKSLLIPYLTKPTVCEYFTKFTTSVLLDTKMSWLESELNRWDQSWSSQRDHILLCGQISTLGRIVSPVSRINGRKLIIIKLVRITQYQLHITLMKFQGHGFKGQGHRQHFPKMHFCGRGIPTG